MLIWRHEKSGSGREFNQKIRKERESGKRQTDTCGSVPLLRSIGIVLWAFPHEFVD